MARIEISGIGIEYELLGESGAHTVVVTPGGRFSKDAPGIRALGEALVKGGQRVLLWDRPNCGASDMCFEGASESLMQGQTLTKLVRALNLGPVALAGGSAGARISMLAAVHDPEVVSHLIPWWISGGTLSLLALGASYCAEPAVAASMGGMAAVAALPSFADQISRNPRSRDVILGQNVQVFIETMERWGLAFVPSEASPIPGLSPQDFARLRMPVLVFRSSTPDLYHPRRVSELFHSLIPHSELIESPWTDEEFLKRMFSADGHFLDWYKLAPAILEFVSR